jgi:hypothetical protein
VTDRRIIIDHIMYEGSMTDQRPLQDPSKPEDADSIIELTDVVTSSEADGEEIIDLMEVVDEDAGRDDVIELTDVVDASPKAAPTMAEAPLEEPVIELTEVVSPDEAQAEATAEESVLQAALEEDHGEIPQVESSTSGELEFADMELDIDDRAEDELFDSMGMNLEAELLPSEEDTSELDFNLSTQELSDAIDLLDAKLAEEPPKMPVVDEDILSEPDALRSDELETALENVIRKMFGEKIDHLLNEAIEKTVSTEIARLKEQLLGDTPEEP